MDPNYPNPYYGQQQHETQMPDNGEILRLEEQNNKGDTEVDFIEHLRQLILGDPIITQRFRRIVSMDYNSVVERNIRLCRMNAQLTAEVNELRQQNMRLVEENELLKERSHVVTQSLKQYAEENNRLVAEVTQLSKQPAARLLRKPHAKNV
eukprot:TRINITY_DN3121_c0_g3_i6.p1 TRINITY_DN3121_c0_g3~~TRINITY_DN3121_c0_g3_i6.p1  ORF type:complete len:151 (-),score=26.93 TRINITY_DN3121_c0_g3_i6:141-593(-)